MSNITEIQLKKIRTSSRLLVRKLGFLNKTLADTDYSASAVHAIIEVGANENITAKDLAETLLLEKSTISRLIKKLIHEDVIEEVKSKDDARKKILKLTKKGQTTLNGINDYAKNKVEKALEPLNSFSRYTVQKGLEIYSEALNNQYDNKLIIQNGYTPGLVGGVAALHGTLYENIVNFGSTFEAKVASGIAEFMPRISNPKNNIWYVKEDNQILASITIDGEDLGNNIAHLRWFIVDTSLQSKGIGSLLLSKALNFCDQNKFSEVHLWTFKGLNAARKLYERNGFILTEEYPDDHWGAEVLEQKFIRKN